MKRAFIVTFGVIVVAVVAWRFWPTEARKLRAEIRSLRRAVERESAPEVMARIDPAYADVHGLDRDGIAAVIEQFFAGVDSVSVQLSGLKVRVDSVGRDRTVFASCSLGVRVLARFEGERVLAFGGIVRPGTVRAWFRKAGPGYRIFRAEY